MKNYLLYIFWLINSISFSQVKIWEIKWQNPAMLDSVASQNKILINNKDGSVYVIQNYFDLEKPSSGIYKFDAYGNQLWNKEFGGIIEKAIADDTSLYFATNFKGLLVLEDDSVFSSDDFNSCALIKTNTEGGILKYRILSTSRSAIAGGLTFGKSGPILSLSHDAKLILDSDTLLTNHNYNASIIKFDYQLNALQKFSLNCASCSVGEIHISDKGNLFFLSDYSSIVFTDSSLFNTGGKALLKLDQYLNPIKAVSINGGGPQYYRFIVDHEENIFLNEITHYNVGFVGNTLYKLDSAFTFVWEKNRFAYPMRNITSRIDFDVDGNNSLYFTGYTTSNYEEIFYSSSIGKIDARGNLLWYITDSTSRNKNDLINVKSKDEFFICGRYRDSITFPPYNFSGDFISFYRSDILNSIKRISTEDSQVIFPNPSSGKFTIQSSAKINSIRVFNSRGEKIGEENMKNISEIDLNDQPPGIYFLEIISGGERTVRKIVVE